MVDSWRNPTLLPGEPFGYTSRADGTIVILYGSAPITTLRGKSAERFADRIRLADAAAAQLLMARATRKFKRGNERAGKRDAV